MQKRFMLAATTLLAFTVTAQAETLQDVQNKIHDIVSKYKSLQFKMKMTSDMSMAGYSAKTTSDSDIQAVKKGDLIMSRVDSRMQTVSNVAGQETKMDMKSLVVDDGKDVWTISETPEKRIAKSKHDEGASVYFNPKAGWKLTEPNFDIKLMSDESVDGKPAWVLAMEPKDPAMKAMQSKTLSYFDKKTGLGIKTVMFGPDNKKSGEIIMSDIKIDSDISADRFTYTPPAGAKVEDMTKVGIPGMAGDKEAPKSAEKTGAGKDKD